MSQSDLINNKKFDLRLYVVIKGVERIEAYVCEEGIVRFCTVSIFNKFTLFRATTRSLMGSI